MGHHRIAVLALSVPLVIAGAASSTGATSRVGEFTASLAPVNKNATGMATLSQHGTTLDVHVMVRDLDGGLHLAHIHGRKQAEAECPALTRDVNGDGRIDFAEGLPDYGPVQVTLSRGDTGPSLDYTRRFKQLDSGDGIASLGPLSNYAIVIHGVDLDGDGVASRPDVDGDGADPDDNEISMPALCGVIN